MLTDTNPAAALARLRKGIKERPSEAKREAALANLVKARKAWAAMSSKKRKREPQPQDVGCGMSGIQMGN